MYILYIDTGFAVSNIMLIKNESILGIKQNNIANTHAQYINIQIEELLNEHQVAFSQLQAITVLNGPGSYTGLRIGLATAKGICFAAGIPLITIHYFELLLISSGYKKEIVHFIHPARINEFFYKKCENGIFDSNEDEIVNTQFILHMIEKGEKVFASDEISHQISDKIQKVSPINSHIATLCYIKFMQKNYDSIYSAEPFYMKKVFINKINKL